MASENHSADVVIIGGGVIGLSLAYRLALQKVTVTVLERGQTGQEASAAGAGILAPQAEMEDMSPLTELCLASRSLYPEFVQELTARTGVDPEYSKSGLLHVSFTEEEEKELDGKQRWQSKLGLRVEKLSAVEVLKLEDWLSHQIRCALLFPEEAYLDNVKLAEALRIACVQLQVCLVTGCQASSLRSEGRRITGILTNLGTWHTSKVVIAAGSWSGMIGASLPYVVPIQPVRGQMVAIKGPAPIFKHVIYSPAGYLVPRRDGRLLLGSTVEWVGYDKNVTLEGLCSIVSAALTLSPRIKSYPVVNTWAGLRPHSEDGAPVMGMTEIEGLYYATGHFRNGILLAPITAKLMTELVLTGTSSELLEPFSPTRFNETKKRPISQPFA